MEWFRSFFNKMESLCSKRYPKPAIQVQVSSSSSSSPRAEERIEETISSSDDLVSTECTLSVSPPADFIDYMQ